MTTHLVSQKPQGVSDPFLSFFFLGRAADVELPPASEVVVVGGTVGLGVAGAGSTDSQEDTDLTDSIEILLVLFSRQTGSRPRGVVLRDATQGAVLRNRRQAGTRGTVTTITTMTEVDCHQCW